MKPVTFLLLFILCGCATPPPAALGDGKRPMLRETVEFTNGGYAIVGEDISKENAS